MSDISVETVPYCSAAVQYTAENCDILSVLSVFVAVNFTRLRCYLKNDNQIHIATVSS